jgi:hypothetical protein
MSSPAPVLASTHHGWENCVDLYSRLLAVQNHLGPKLPGVSRKRGLEPAEVDLFDQLEVEQPRVG